MLGALELTNAFRGILWSFAKFFLGLADYCYEILRQMMNLKMEDLSWFWTIYVVLMVFTGLFIIVRLVFIWLKSIYDEQAKERINGANLFVRIAMVVFILSSVPVVMPLAFNTMAGLTEKMPNLLVGNDVKISQVIVDASINGFKITNTRGEIINNNDISNEKREIIEQAKQGGEDVPEDIENVDTSATNINNVNLFDIVKDNINARKNHDAKSYFFFQDIVGILLALALGGICSVLLIYIAFQVGMRFASLLFKIFLAPYALSGLVDPADNGTTTWFKLCTADILGNFFQMLFLWLSLLLTIWFNKAGLVKAIFFLACIMGILYAPQGVAQLLGSDIGASSGMQSLRQGLQFLNAAVGGFKLGGKGLLIASKGARATKNMGQAGLYGAARLTGLQSLRNGNTTSSSSSSDEKGSSSNSGISTKENSLASKIQKSFRSASSGNSLMSKGLKLGGKAFSNQLQKGATHLDKGDIFKKKKVGLEDVIDAIKNNKS